MDAKSLKSVLEVFKTLAQQHGHTYDALARYNDLMQNQSPTIVPKRNAPTGPISGSGSELR